MSIVTVKTKYQVVIPQNVREQIGVAVGDTLEARAEKGRIVFEPKSIVDCAIAEGLEDIRKGRVEGPFDTVDEMLASLKGAAKPHRKQSRRSR
ncbi:MAG: AbrB/MazE/SpoVT family DNA-binding domain-containing protein [Terriglobia bacterium]